MITKEYLKAAIEQAEYNNSGEHVDYEITDIKELSEEGAFLVFAESKEYNVQTSFVAYGDDGTCLFLTDWQGPYPTTEKDIENYQNWATINWERRVLVFNGLPRIIF